MTWRSGTAERHRGQHRDRLGKDRKFSFSVYKNLLRQYIEFPFKKSYCFCRATKWEGLQWLHCPSVCPRRIRCFQWLHRLSVCLSRMRRFAVAVWSRPTTETVPEFTPLKWSLLWSLHSLNQRWYEFCFKLTGIQSKNHLLWICLHFYIMNYEKINPIHFYT